MGKSPHQLDRVRDRVRVKLHSIRTETQQVQRVRRLTRPCVKADYFVCRRLEYIYPFS
jgi:hypothetical protein